MAPRRIPQIPQDQFPEASYNNSESSDPIFNLQLEASLHKTYDKSENNRPTATKSAYASHQKRFLAWCEESDRDPMTRYTVTGPKVNSYLHARILNRLNHHKKAKGNDGSAHTPIEDSRTGSNAEVEEEGILASSSGKTVGYPTVALCIAALVDLWAQQCRKKANSNPNPRIGAVGILATTLRLENQKYQRSNYIDRGSGTHLEGYQGDDLLRISKHWLTKNSETSLRDRLSFLFCHNAMMRGDNMRRMELCDLHTRDLGEVEGFKKSCIAVVCTMKSGKTNHFGKAEYGGFMRNKDPNICPVGALAFYFFSRFHISNEKFPSFARNSDWYDVKVIKHPNADRIQPMKYKTHMNAVTVAFNEVGIVSGPKTHSSRRAGAQYAELQGAGEDSIRRAGRWNSNAMEGAYLSSLPRETMRALAGFNSSGGTYHLERDVEVPANLQEMVFPLADKWLNAVRSGKDEDGNFWQKDMACEGFIQLLIFLRSVFWQDAISLRQSHPELFIYKHEFFQSSEFTQWASTYNGQVRERVDPIERRLQLALPLLHDQMKNGQTAILDHVDRCTLATAAKVDHMTQKFKSLENSVNDYNRAMLALMSNVLDKFKSSSEACQLVPANLTSQPSHSSIELPPSIEEVQITDFTMDRQLSTCKDLCREWYSGLAGKLSIEHMDQRCGNEWRKSEKDRKFYSRRLVIIEEIRRLSTQHRLSYIQAAILLDNLRMSQANTSLAALEASIRSNKLPEPDSSAINSILLQQSTLQIIPESRPQVNM